MTKLVSCIGIHVDVVELTDRGNDRTDARLGVDWGGSWGSNNGGRDAGGNAGDDGGRRSLDLTIADLGDGLNLGSSGGNGSEDGE
jgi:hypothetical protein